MANQNALNNTNKGNFDVTGQLTVNDYTFPSADGNINQVIRTDGAGQLSFQESTPLYLGTSVVSGGSGVADFDLSSFTYNRVLLRFRQAFVGSVGAAAIYLLVSDNTGSSFYTSGYIGGVHEYAFNSATFANTSSTTRFNLGTNIIPTGSGYGLTGNIFIDRGLGGWDSVGVYVWGETISMKSTTVLQKSQVQGVIITTNKVDYIRVTTGGGLADFTTYDVYA